MKSKQMTAREELLKSIGRIGDELKIAVYVVGGYVRDSLLGIAGQDIDFVVVGDGPAFALEARNRMNGHGWTVFKKFGTASFICKDFKLEFVSARKESYRDDSRKPSVEQTDLKEDLMRRDFTINAMAMNLSNGEFGEIIDLFNGKTDLEARLIRTPLDPEATFSEDPLRMMRAARFASQLRFVIDEQALAAMATQKKRLRIVSQERITDELIKILMHDQPSIGFHILQDTGILKIILPEMAALTGVEQREDHHHKDVFEHTLKVLDNIAQVTDNPILRFTALMHDIGKPSTKRFVPETGWTFHGHEFTGRRMLRNIVKRLKLSNEFLNYSQKLTGLHMRPIQLIGEEVTDSAIRRLLFQAGDSIDDLMMLCRADITSGNPSRVQQYLTNFDHVMERMTEVEEKDRMRAFQSPVRGEEIMDICDLKPGPMVGKIKTMIEEAILDGEIPNDHEAAYQYLLNVKTRLSADCMNTKELL